MAANKKYYSDKYGKVISQHCRCGRRLIGTVSHKQGMCSICARQKKVELGITRFSKNFSL